MDLQPNIFTYSTKTGWGIGLDNKKLADAKKTIEELESKNYYKNIVIENGAFKIIIYEKKAPNIKDWAFVIITSTGCNDHIIYIDNFPSFIEIREKLIISDIT